MTQLQDLWLLELQIAAVPPETAEDYAQRRLTHGKMKDLRARLGFDSLAQELEAFGGQQWPDHPLTTIGLARSLAPAGAGAGKILHQGARLCLALGYLPEARELLFGVLQETEDVSVLNLVGRPPQGMGLPRWAARGKRALVGGDQQRPAGPRS